jgi:hypothetical protein
VRTGAALEHIYAIDPTYSAAHLLDAALRDALNPAQVPALHRTPDAPGQGVAPYQVTWTRLSGQMGYADSHAKRAVIRAADSRYPSARAMSSLRPSARTPIITSRHSLCSSSRMLRWMPSAHT